MIVVFGTHIDLALHLSLIACNSARVFMCDYPPRYVALGGRLLAAYVRYMSSPLGEVFHELSGVARYEHLAPVFQALTCETCHV